MATSRELDLQLENQNHYSPPTEISAPSFGKNQRSRSKLMEGKDSIQCKGINQKNKQRCRNAAIMEYLGPRPEYCAEHIDCDPNSLYTKCSATYEKKNKGLKKCKEVVLKEFGRCYKHFDGFLNQFSTRDTYDNLKISYERIFSLLIEHEKQTAQAKLTNLDLYQRKNKLTPKYQEMKNQALEKLNEFSRDFGFPIVKDESPRQDPDTQPPVESKKRKRPLSTSAPESLSSPPPSSFWGEELLLKKQTPTFGAHSRFTSKKAFPLSSLQNAHPEKHEDYSTLLSCPSYLQDHPQYYQHCHPDRPPTQKIPSQLLFRPPKYGERLRIPDNMTLSLLGRRYLQPIDHQRSPYYHRVLQQSSSRHLGASVKRETCQKEKILISSKSSSVYPMPHLIEARVKKEPKEQSEWSNDLVSIDRLSENLEVPLSQYMMTITSLLSSSPANSVPSHHSINSPPSPSSPATPSSPLSSSSSSTSPSPSPRQEKISELFETELTSSPSQLSDEGTTDSFEGEVSDFDISFDDYPAFSFSGDS